VLTVYPAVSCPPPARTRPRVYVINYASILWVALRVLPVRLSVCPSIRLSVCPVRAGNSKTKKRRKNKVGIDVPRARVSGVPIFNRKGQRSSPILELQTREQLSHGQTPRLLEGWASNLRTARLCTSAATRASSNSVTAL